MDSFDDTRTKIVFEVDIYPIIGDVINNCIVTLKDYFNIDKWQINQPIILSDVTSCILQIRGVQSVVGFQQVSF